MGVITYIKESMDELRGQVKWPTRAEAQNLMIVVAVFSIIFSLATWGVDTVFSKAIGGYFDWLKDSPN